MSKPNHRTKAAMLRKQGLSYLEIKRELDVSKSTLSLWLRDIKLAPEHQERLYTKQVRFLSFGAQSQRERRKREVEEIISKAKAEIKIPICDQAFKLMGVALYWAEGRKDNELAVTNSDPNLILFIVKWFERIFGANALELKARLNIYSQQNELEIKSFWSELTGIPLANFGKSYIKPANNGFKKNNLYYGTITISVPKGTDNRLRVFGWVQAVLREVAPEVGTIQNRWQKLREVKRPVNL